MDVRSRPPRIFGVNNTLIPFKYVPAVGKDILRKHFNKKEKKKPLYSEKILFFDEIVLDPKNKNSIAQIILTDIRLVYVMV
jgi:hypothetical protein